MQISQEELQRRLGTSKNLLNRIVPNPKTSNRGNDENNRNNAGRLKDLPNAPPSLRSVAGILSKAEGNSSQVARNLALTPGQVRYAKDSSEEKLTEKKVQELALTRLMDAVGLLTVDVIADEKPKDIASIAANLSRVHSNLRSRDHETEGRVQVNIYSPQQKSLDDYETIEVRTGT